MNSAIGSYGISLTISCSTCAWERRRKRSIWRCQKWCGRIGTKTPEGERAVGTSVEALFQLGTSRLEKARPQPFVLFLHSCATVALSIHHVNLNDLKNLMEVMKVDTAEITIGLNLTSARRPSISDEVTSLTVVKSYKNGGDKRLIKNI